MKPPLFFLGVSMVAAAEVALTEEVTEDALSFGVVSDDTAWRKRSRWRYPWSEWWIDCHSVVELV